MLMFSVARFRPMHFAEKHYSLFNMISYGSRSHLCIFNRCVFLERVREFFASRRLRFWFHRHHWKRSRNTSKMQCSVAQSRGRVSEPPALCYVSDRRGRDWSHLPKCHLAGEQGITWGGAIAPPCPPVATPLLGMHLTHWSRTVRASSMTKPHQRAAHII